jgi:UDPglucose 6-dehydrogenase
MINGGINIIGYGFVGNSIGYICNKNNIEFAVYDIDKNKSDTDTLSSCILNSEKYNSINYYFICVPTCSNLDGSCDISLVENVLTELSKLISKESIIIVKSTVVPGTMDNFSLQFPNLNLVFCPEFLREKNANEDAYDAEFILLGTLENIELDFSQSLLKLFRQIYKHNSCIDIYFKSFKVTELFKYSVNVYLGVKVWYFNEIYEVCEKLNVDYNVLKSLFSLEERIGTYGTTIPGDHGFGFSGKCLPKETSGFINLQKTLNLNSKVFEEILNKNKQFRLKIKKD